MITASCVNPSLTFKRAVPLEITVDVRRAAKAAGREIDFVVFSDSPSFKTKLLRVKPTGEMRVISP